ncbi:MAG TPA: hypothetical protein VF519_18805 [Mycobacteriales bacterium]|jgi:hypothetical protein
MRGSRSLVVLGLVAAATFWTRPAFACSCAGPPELPAAVANADVVFEGEVVAYVGEGKSEVRVDRVYKGRVRRITLLHTDLAPFSSCSASPPGPGPVVYAGPRELVTGQCRHVMFRTSEDVGLPGYAPLPGADDRGGGGWVSAAIAALGVVSLPIARRTPEERRRRRRDAADLAALRLAR